MKPGYKYTSGEYHGECLREAFACATGISRKSLPHINADKETVDSFWDKWKELTRERGYEFEEFEPNGENEPEGFWIALVHAYPGREASEGHAVVMKGKRLWHDPSYDKRKQRPHAFYGGFRLVPIADH